MKNPFRKVVFEEILICPQFAKYDSNFIETRKYETRYIWWWFRERSLFWAIKLNPMAWLIFGIFLLYCKIKHKDWKKVLEDC